MIYLLHFDRPLAHARHYLGSTDDLDARLAAHRSGAGARVMAVLAERGIGFQLARTWPGGRTEERRLKRWHKHRVLCPLCGAAGAANPRFGA